MGDAQGLSALLETASSSLVFFLFAFAFLSNLFSSDFFNLEALWAQATGKRGERKDK